MMLAMRTDQPPCNNVRVRHAISHAIDRQGLIEAVWGRGQVTPATAPGLTEWSLPLDQLGAGAQYYQYNPQEAKRLLANAGFANGLKTQPAATGGIGIDHLDTVQLFQRALKDVGMAGPLSARGDRPSNAALEPAGAPESRPPAGPDRLPEHRSTGRLAHRP
jgi:peptide/nickel transport system substrate-binding protein